MAKKEKTKGSHDSTTEKINLSAKADIKSVIAKSSSKRKGFWRQLFGFAADQPALLVGFIALLLGLFYYNQKSIQSLLIPKFSHKDSNFAHVNNSQVLGSVDMQEQVNFNFLRNSTKSYFLIRLSKFTTYCSVLRDLQTVNASTHLALTTM